MPIVVDSRRADRLSPCADCGALRRTGNHEPPRARCLTCSGRRRARAHRLKSIRSIVHTLAQAVMLLRSFLDDPMPQAYGLGTRTRSALDARVVQLQHELAALAETEMIDRLARREARLRDYKDLPHARS